MTTRRYRTDEGDRSSDWLSSFPASWFYGTLRPVKTTLEIPDDLFRAAKAKAAMDGIRLKDLVTEGLRLVVHGPAARRSRQRVSLPLVHSARPGSLDLSGEAIASAEARIDAEHGR